MESLCTMVKPHFFAKYRRGPKCWCSWMEATFSATISRTPTCSAIWIKEGKTKPSFVESPSFLAALDQGGQGGEVRIVCTPKTLMMVQTRLSRISPIMTMLERIPIRNQRVGFVHTHTWEIQSICSSLCYTFIDINHDGISDIFQGFVHDIHATSPSTQTTAKFSKTGSKRTTSLLTDHPPRIPSKIHHKDRVPVEEFNAKIPNVQDCPISKKWRATTYKLDKNCTMTFASSLQPGTRIRQITIDGYFREFWGWCPFTTQTTKMFHRWPLVERAHTCWKVWAKHLSPNITG